MRRIVQVISLAAVLAALAPLPAVAQAQNQAAKPAPARPLLPEAFSGWLADGAIQQVTEAARADPASAAALAEYSFTGADLATYKRDGETLTIHALHFHDISGSYGAYTFYRQNGWPKEEIGYGATSFHNRVLFWQGVTVIDATFSHIGPMSAAELRDLASQLPNPGKPTRMPAPVVADLPLNWIDGPTTHYAVGPAGYQTGGVLPAQLIGFELGAEVATANYNLRSNPATLTIIDYPTPQMAMAQEAKIRAYIQAGKNAQPAWPKPLQDSNPSALEVRRSGPLVALVSGDAIPEESHKLLALVHFQADVASIPLPSESEVHKTGRLLVGIALLVVIGSLAAILLGFFLGGGRALYRIARGKPASSLYDEEFTSLNLNTANSKQPAADSGGVVRE
jgi:hypothetical protein